MPDECPCGSGRAYADCCERYHEGAVPPTAEALMRSRYSAYAKRRPEYLLDTALHKGDRASIESWMQSAEFLRLEILRCRKGKALDKKGFVEFKAYYLEGQRERVLHEVSAFVKRRGRWYYDQESSAAPGS
ncbi:YchJ family protein [Hydrogenimonas sp.]